MRPRCVTRAATSSNFLVAPEPPYLRGGTVRENQKAERGPDSLWGAAGVARPADVIGNRRDSKAPTIPPNYA